MPKNSSKYKQGDIVVLELPFTDLLGSKLRPVLVLNAINLGDDVIVAKITGSPGLHRIPITQLDLAMGRLKREPSYIDCSSIFTVEKKLVMKVVGRLAEEALLKVKEELSNIFSLK
ncbi:MAG: type II toxin-antitoxin system PemK/MazF family toxin [Desulfurococcales archaeon]|nr:type II toxin-antitoxin system PemK/MazF family toxin [Desulfurococcales archaeon]